jgi:hypothetical protein
MPDTNRVTMVTTFRPFTDDAARIIQRSAVRSWIVAGCEQIVAIGDEPGVEALAKEWGLTHVPPVRRASELSLACPHPMMRDIFDIGVSESQHDLVCFINSDIIVQPDFITTLTDISAKYDDPFVTGVRCDIELKKEAATDEDFGRLWADADKVLNQHGGTDFFAFSIALARRIRDGMPDYVWGATAWDNWLQVTALKLAHPPIDATNVLPTLHPRHNYATLLRGSPGCRRVSGHPAVQHNRRLYRQGGRRGSVKSPGWTVL